MLSALARSAMQKLNGVPVAVLVRNSCVLPVPSVSALPKKVLFPYCDLVSQYSLFAVEPVSWVAEIPYQELLVTE